MTDSNQTPALPEWPARLRDMLVEYFSLDDLASLCLDVDVDFEELGEGAKSRRVVRLITLMADNGRLPLLLDRCTQLRSNLDWTTVREQAEAAPELFHLSDSTDDQILTLLHQIAEQTLVTDSDAKSIESQPAEPGDAPYLGLQYFTEADADHFFGRELLTAQVIKRLYDERFLAVIGASGSGKSSLVRAGVVPALRRAEPLADGSPLPANSSQWLMRLMTPTAHPLDALAAVLTQDSESVTAVIDMQSALSQNNRALTLAAQQRLAKQNSPRLLLVIDQFEEIFTLCRQPDERKAFIDNLVTAVNPEDNQPITILITLRADFYAQCAQDDNLRRLVSQQQEYIGAMSREELARAIVQPAALGNWRIQEGLVEQMLDDVGDEPGALPLLSHALLETWVRRRGRTMTLSGYRESGGVRGAIAQTAETIFQQRLTPEQQPIARMIFVRLTELGESVDGETPDTRRRAAFSELITRTTDPDMLNAVLDILTQSRLVTTDLLPPDETKVVEVSHEALIREWPTLRHWLDEDRESLIRQRQLTDDVNDWLKLDRDAGALYRGVRLQQMQTWAHSFPEPLSAEEQAFLDASQTAVQAEAEREARLTRSQRTQRIMLGVVALLVVLFIGGLIYIFANPGRTANQLETMVTPTICVPQTMPGDFNVAIAEFVVLDETGNIDTTNRSGQQLTGRVQKHLQTTFADEDSIAVWADGDELMTQFCTVIGVVGDDLAGVTAPATIAEQIKADVVIYGTLSPVNQQGALQLKFYVAPQLGMDVSNMVGTYTFEKPIPVFDIEDPGSEVDILLGSQAEALARTARGFTQETLGLQAEALADFEQAAAAAPESSFTHFFVGQENLFLAEATEGDESLAFQAAAEAAFNQASGNARAQIGLGSLHLLRAQRQLTEILNGSLEGEDRLAALDANAAEAEQALALYTAV
ncbi:MAG: ATP-binding protein, partial [Anaerolineae bacterium]|nr:ATP-binding protein [Anaerolineae bacterium]